MSGRAEVPLVAAPFAGVSAQRNSRTGGAILVAAAFVLLSFALLHTLIPSATAIQIGADEGFELAKATLLRHGHKLYTEVWNDQPPLHTFVVAGILHRLSSTVLAARSVTIMSTGLLLASIFLISLSLHGWRVAFGTTALMIVSPGFLELSASCMLEIPALAPAVAALCVLICARWNSILPEIAAGLLFAAALQTKLIVAVYLPLTLMIFWLRNANKPALVPTHRSSNLKAKPAVPGRSRFTIPPLKLKNIGFPLLILCGVLGLGFVGIDLLVDSGAFLLHFAQTWSSHFGAVKSFEFSSPGEHRFDWSVLLKNWDTTVPALIGIMVCLRNLRGQVGALLPLAWLALTLVVFGIHSPWWPYYYVHNAIPLCWCAALGLQELFLRARVSRSIGLRAATALFGIGAAAWIGSRVYFQIQSIRESPQIGSSLVLGQLARLKPFSQFLYTDEPVYSFHADIPMPPDLAVIPLKRLWSGNMTRSRIAEQLWETKPGVILLATGSSPVNFQELINAEYRIVFEDGDHRLYALKSIAKKAGY